MSDEEARSRLEHVWNDASAEVRRAFLGARYREQGAIGEWMIQIMGQVNVTDLGPCVAACAPAVKLGVGTGSSWRR